MHVNAPDVLDQVIDHLRKQCNFDSNKCIKINQHICIVQDIENWSRGSA